MNPDIGATIAFGILALLLLLMGKRRGFFTFPLIPWDTPINLFHVLGSFAIYFSATYAILSIAVKLIKTRFISDFLAYSSWLNFLISLIIFLLLFIYLFYLPNNTRMGILRRPNEKHSFKNDLWAAAYAWILAFPPVLFFSQSLELILTKVFHIPYLPDQIAVKFLKSTFEHPLYFTFAVLSITVFAPLIEETLFRGFLQSYIRSHLGPRQAIVITSFCFSLFHYSAGQGIGNITIISSLFILSLFLGFIYEKQGSIFASMSLHALFNLVSVINLYLFGGFTTGL